MTQASVDQVLNFQEIIPVLTLELANTITDEELQQKEVKEGTKMLISNMKKEPKNEQDQNFFLCDDGLSAKKGTRNVSKKRHNNGKINARNFLTNIAYSRLNKDYHKNRSLIGNVLGHFSCKI